MTTKGEAKSENKPDFKVYDADFLGEKLGMNRTKFHREIKSRIRLDFKEELNAIGIKNPDIGLDREDIIYLTDSTRHKVFNTGLNINSYL